MAPSAKTCSFLAAGAAAHRRGPVKHVTHVLGKLGAANRTEAAARGPAAGPDPLTSHPSRPGSTLAPAR